MTVLSPPGPPLSAAPAPTQSELNAAAASWAALKQKLDYLSADDLNQVRSAYRFADEAHLGQMRSSGEPYITHPLAVAGLCADWKLDVHAIMAALLHDAMEDCGVSKGELIERFGSPTADLVDGLTKLDKLNFSTREESQAESFRKMLLAMARDVRVMLIKLADRLHNMRTLDCVPREKWGRVSSETMDIYVPIAHRLGLNQSYRELQDLSFKYQNPWRYQSLSKAVNKARGRRRDLVQRIESSVVQALKELPSTLELFGREKTLFSIYRKMKLKHLSFAQVTDIFGFRVVVHSLTDCYVALGLLHQLYKPMPGRFKDYIAIPKVNGYQSLHTTVIGPYGTPVEFQIRTESMHLVAETGVAAHWLYKINSDKSEDSERLGTRWLSSLLDIQAETRDAAEFLEHVKIDLFPTDVYVFTPQSKILSLPRGATVVDFAFAVHSDLGDHAHAAKINGEAVALHTELRNGDRIEVITSPEAHPHPSWLNFVRTGRARSKIRAYLKTLEQDEAIIMGVRLLVQSLRAEGIDQLPPSDGLGQKMWEKLLRFTGNKSRNDLLQDIGLGKRMSHIVAKRLVALLSEEGIKGDALLLTQTRFAHDAPPRGTVFIDGSEGGTLKLASCCHPIPGDHLIGHLGRGAGLVVHTHECATGKRLQQRDEENWISVDWSDEPIRRFEAGIEVTLQDGKGMLAKVAGVLASSDVDITHVEMGEERAQVTTTLRFMVSVRDRVHLASALRSLKRVPAVVRATRIKSGSGK